MSFTRQSPTVDQLPVTPSSRPLRPASPPSVSQGRVGLVTPGNSVADRSPSIRPNQDHSGGPALLQALLAEAATLTALLDPASLLSTPSIAPEPMGLRNYGIPAPRSSGPSLPWNSSHGDILASLDDNSRSSPKFHHATSTERSGFAFPGALLTCGRRRSWHLSHSTMG